MLTRSKSAATSGSRVPTQAPGRLIPHWCTFSALVRSLTWCWFRSCLAWAERSSSPSFVASRAACVSHLAAGGSEPAESLQKRSCQSRGPKKACSSTCWVEQVEDPAAGRRSLRAQKGGKKEFLGQNRSSLWSKKKRAWRRQAQWWPCGGCSSRTISPGGGASQAVALLLLGWPAAD